MVFPRVVRKVKVEGKWQFLPVAKQGDKLDWTHLRLRGVSMVFTTGTFYLDYREAGSASAGRSVIIRGMQKLP
jgi:hypothetical protein